MGGKFDPTRFSEQTLYYMSEAIDGMMLDPDGRFLAASKLCLEAFGETDFKKWEGKRVDQVLDAYDAENFPGSEFCCNGGRAFREAIERARAVGVYTSFGWMLNKSGALLRMNTFVRKCPIGFAVVLVPVDDAFSGAFTGYDAETGWISTRMFPRAWTWEDISILDELMAGHSKTQTAKNLGITVDRVRYRVRRAEKEQGVDLAAIIRAVWSDASDERMPSKAAIFHGKCEKYR